METHVTFWAVAMTERIGFTKGYMPIPQVGSIVELSIHKKDCNFHFRGKVTGVQYNYDLINEKCRYCNIHVFMEQTTEMNTTHIPTEGII